MTEFSPADVHLRPLRAFDAVARYRSFSRAAAELGRTQTTVSLQVRELERQLGSRLVERTTRRVSLTDSGAKLAEALEVGFRAIDLGLVLSRRQAEGHRCRILLAFVPHLFAARRRVVLSPVP